MHPGQTAREIAAGFQGVAVAMEASRGETHCTMQERRVLQYGGKHFLSGQTVVEIL